MNEFRLMPQLPYEYEEYEIVRGVHIADRMNEGWVILASVNCNDINGKGMQVNYNRFLMGKGLKASPSMNGNFELRYTPSTAEDEAPLPVSATNLETPPVSNEESIADDMDELLGIDLEDDDDLVDDLDDE